MVKLVNGATLAQGCAIITRIEQRIIIMKIRNCLTGLTILTLAGVSLTSFAAKSSSSYIDDEGYCVVNIHPSNKIKYVRQDVINVPDIKDHVLRIHLSEQEISDTKLCNGDSLVSGRYSEMGDYIDHDGGAQGYNIFNTEKGDQLFVKYTANSQKMAGEDFADYQNTGRIIGGTGALAAAEGDTQYIGKFNRHKEIINTIIFKIRYKIASEDTKKTTS